MNRVKVFSLCLLGVLLIAGASVTLGVAPLSRGHNSARPPCEQLPDRKSVVDAVASHKGLVTRIQKVGPGVKVDVATPCEGQPGRALVRIKYTTDTEWKGVDAILQQDGFGVPAELVGN